jgi:hypothetical protein
MKKLKMILMATATFIGLGAVFAFSPRVPENAVTYYAVKNGSSFIWQTTSPAPLRCSASPSINAICTIVTNNTPTNGVVPPGHSGNNTLYQ